jgi:hypothetical protein
MTALLYCFLQPPAVALRLPRARIQKEHRSAPEVLVGCLVGGHQPCVEAAQATHKPEENEGEDHERNGSTTLACGTQQQQQQQQQRRRRRRGQGSED